MEPWEEGPDRWNLCPKFLRETPCAQRGRPAPLRGQSLPDNLAVSLSMCIHSPNTTSTYCWSQLINSNDDLDTTLQLTDGFHFVKYPF